MSAPFPASDTDHVILPEWFRGFDPMYQESDRCSGTYHRNLPHWRYAGASYFLTFRLADSLPASVLREMREAAALWESQHAAREAHGGVDSDGEIREARDTFQKEQFTRMEQHLDRGHGSCVLREAENRRIVEETLRYFEGIRCRMAAYVVMPNHVHALCQPLEGWDLEDLLGSWKKHSALAINRRLGRCGALWQRESYDRIVRDADHFRRVVRYLIRNPVRANLSQDDAAVWLHPGIQGKTVQGVNAGEGKS
jgi:putative transposase